MITVAEHTYEETLLPEKANILDLGCRGFLFTNELILQGHNVISVDADSEVKSLAPKHHTLAITNFNGVGTLIKSDDPQASRVEVKRKLAKLPSDVNCSTLQSFSKMVGITFWDLIKIDVEGSEYDIIMSLGKPPAKQLSIEFHLHTKVYGYDQMKEMELKLLSLGYFPAKHDKTSAHGMGLNYWDSLWILK